MIEYKTIRQFAAESGYTEGAIRAKIYRGVFREGEVWVRSPDNRKLISVEGFNEWGTKGQELSQQVQLAYKSPLHTKVSNVVSSFQVAPLKLT